MTTNNDFARPADLLESSNHAAELTARAHKAVLRADTLATPLSLLPRLSARPTVPAPPASYPAALAAAQARLDEAEILDREALLRQWREAEDTRALDLETDEGAS